jgi:hypothetical protein
MIFSAQRHKEHGVSQIFFITPQAFIHLSNHQINKSTNNQINNKEKNCIFAKIKF